jgi:uncharacterized membrane protein YagU involved in acid resistance
MEKTKETQGWSGWLGVGAVAGIIAGVMMAMYAMIASATFLHEGFFTPLYGIASPLVGMHDVMLSMQHGMFVDAGPMLLGLMVHMLWSAVYGIIFGLIARALHLSGILAVSGGLVYGLVILLLMSFIVLPVVGAGLLPAMVGWPSFTVQHLIFGMVLGLWPVLRPQDFSRFAGQAMKSAV